MQGRALTLILKREAWLDNNTAHPVGNWFCFLFWPKACWGQAVAELSALLPPLGCSLQRISVLTPSPLTNLRSARVILLQHICQSKPSEAKILPWIVRGWLMRSSYSASEILLSVTGSWSFVLEPVFRVYLWFLEVVQMEDRSEVWREERGLTASPLIKWSFFSRSGILCCHNWRCTRMSASA